MYLGLFLFSFFNLVICQDNRIKENIMLKTTTWISFKSDLTPAFTALWNALICKAISPRILEIESLPSVELIKELSTLKNPPVLETYEQIDRLSDHSQLKKQWKWDSDKKEYIVSFHN